MEDLTSGAPAKRTRKRLFDLNINDVFDVDALFEESGSEYNPESDTDNDLEEINITVSITAFVFPTLCWLPCYAYAEKKYFFP